MIGGSNVLRIPLKKIKRIVLRVIDKLIVCDSALFNLDASEWSIAHRLAVYLEQDLPGWHVDCEYNRQGLDLDSVKRGSTGKRMRPDICIHHRGELALEHNLLVIEIKKSDSTHDFEKASEYTKCPAGKRKFQYQYGLALSMSLRELVWFKNGDRIDA
jgi:hypothetical protein